MGSSFIVPQMPPQLIEALKRQQGPPMPPGMPPGTAPLNGRSGMIMPQGPMPGPLPMAQPTPSGALPPPPSSATSTLGPMAPKEATVPTKTGAPVPAPTDDPAVVGMGAMPKTPDLGSYLNPALKQYQSDLSGYQQADVANRINPQQVKPKLWERLLGGVLGATQLKNPENAGNVAGQVVHRDLNRAELQRKTAMAPWTERLQMDKEGLPLAEASAKTGYEQGQLGLHAAGEQRERFTAVTNAQAKEDLNNIREEWNQDREKNNQEKNAAYLQHITDLENKYKDDAAMREELFHLRERVEDFKESKSDKAKPSQSVGIEAKKATALQKAKAAYDKETDLAGSDPEARATAETNFKQAQQDAQDAYEAEINAAGGTADHQDVESWRGKPAAGAKPATAAPAGTAKPAATAPATKAGNEELPTVAGPANEKPLKTGNNGQYGYYKSTGQWMLVPNSTGGR